MIKILPYKNLSLKDIPGEKWKDICGYEGQYQISNFGRVKSLPKYIEFLIPGKHIVAYWTPERILAQGLQKTWNSISKEEIYNLNVTFCIGQKIKTAIVSRLVWNAFIGKLDFEKDRLCILHKDGEGRNNYYLNLTTGGQSIVAKKAYKQGRLIRLEEYLNDAVFAKSASGRSKPVTQYDLNGNRIKIYNSVRNAVAVTKAYSSSIALVARGKKLQAGGFIWRYGKGRKKIDVSFYYKAKEAFRKLFSKPVIQFDLMGNRIKKYSSIKEAANAVGSPPSAISCAVLGKYKTAKGFIWKPDIAKRK